jgi:hypothetical protein
MEEVPHRAAAGEDGYAQLSGQIGRRQIVDEEPFSLGKRFIWDNDKRTQRTTSERGEKILSGKEPCHRYATSTTSRDDPSSKLNWAMQSRKKG